MAAVLISYIFGAFLPMLMASPLAIRLVPAFLRSPVLRTSTSLPISRIPRAPHHILQPAVFSRAFSNTTRTMGYDSKTLLDAAKERRSIYTLNKKPPISDDRIQEIIQNAITHVPSSFNSQSTRLVVLLNEDHDKFWDMTTNILKGIVPEDKWEKTAGRMSLFHGAYGSILFYEDPEPIQSLQNNLPEYADRFPVWSEHTSAMHQYFLWTALEAEGLGANLQHYNPLPDQKASETWGIPATWSLKAQLVFGGLEPGAREKLPEKKFEPVEKRVKVYGAKSS